jgi:signal transduction histidine kinase
MQGSGQIVLATRLNGAGESGGEEHTVEVSLTDSGPGIPAPVLSEVFKPFFTTKPRGTGLGLAISRRIIEDHGGWIRAESPPGQGATFRICLPVCAADRRSGGHA